MLNLDEIEKGIDNILESETKISLTNWLLENRVKSVIKKHKNAFVAQNMISKSQFIKAFDRVEKEIIELIKIEEH